MGDGPFILIALPADEESGHIPINATKLLREWEFSLHPKHLLRDVARGLLEQVREWMISEHFVEPTPSTIHLIREIAGDDEFVEILRNAKATIAQRSGFFRNPGKLLPVCSIVFDASSYEDPANLRETALPLLLGLAVLAALHVGAGFHSFQVARAILEEREKRPPEFGFGLGWELPPV